MTKKNEYKVALIGNPNCGKTTLFNQLTGLNQKVGNFAGVTVERKSGTCEISPGDEIQIIDLPGTYSIYPKSYDEQIVFDILTNPSSEDFPDLIAVIVDASNLKRNLLLFSQIYDLGLPVILGLNMIDVAEKAGLIIDEHKMADYFSIPVLKMNARKGEGMNELKKEIKKIRQSPVRTREETFVAIENSIINVYRQIKTEINCESDYKAQLIAHQYKTIRWIPAYKKIKIAEILKSTAFDSIKIQTNETIQRYQKINQIYDYAVNAESYNARHRLSENLDKLFTHRVFGYFMLLAIFYMIFQSIFSWATYPMDLIDLGVTNLNSAIKSFFPSNAVVELCTDGIIAGLGGVIMFIPQISLLFAFIAILEETGYMARVMFLMDNIMKFFGLNGKSIVPLFSGAACAIPAIMATRNIGNQKEKLITIFVTPLISCSARIPVYTIIIALIIPATRVLGIFNLQGLTMMFMYFLGFMMALISALLLKFIIKAKEKSFFILEMPDYKMPKWNNVIHSVIEKVKSFVFGAGKIIVSISIILWFLSSYGPPEQMKNARTNITSDNQVGAAADIDENKIASAKLEASYAGHFGKFIEPMIKPLGFDWKIGIALITSFAAREVFVGTISTIYSVGEDDSQNSSLKEKLAKQVDTETGKPFFNFARGMSLLVFYAFALQCMSTIAVVKKETGKWRIALLQFLYMAAISYLFALLTYNICVN